MPLPTLLALLPLFAAPDLNPPTERGSVRFVPVDDQKNVPERYRLEPRTFEYELTFKFDLQNAGVRVEILTFPSAVQIGSAPTFSSRISCAARSSVSVAGMHRTLVVIMSRAVVIFPP